MNKRLVGTALITTGGLGVVVAALGMGWTARLLALLSFGGALLLLFWRQLVVVPERTVLVIMGRRHDQVLEAVAGPRTLFLWPLVEKPGLTFSTDCQLAEVYVDNAPQADQKPGTCGFHVHLQYRLAPQNLSPAALRDNLPFLTEHRTWAVQHWTTNYLRALIADIQPWRVDPQLLPRIQSRLRGRLARHLGSLGMELVGVQVDLCPSQGLRDTLLQVEQMRVRTPHEVERLQMILAALAGQAEPLHGLALLELAGAYGRHGGQTMATLDMASLLAGGRNGRGPRVNDMVPGPGV
jgi:hypothetical protein